MPYRYKLNVKLNEPGHEKMCHISYANNKGADQPAHPRSLISAFVVRCLDSLMSLVSVTKFQNFLLASVAEQAGLSLTASEPPPPRKTCFLMTRLKCNHTFEGSTIATFPCPIIRHNLDAIEHPPEPPPNTTMGKRLTPFDGAWIVTPRDPTNCRFCGVSILDSFVAMVMSS